MRNTVIITKQCRYSNSTTYLMIQQRTAALKLVICISQK